jgi:hypothetical protein
MISETRAGRNGFSPAWLAAKNNRESFVSRSGREAEKSGKKKQAADIVLIDGPGDRFAPLSPPVRARARLVGRDGTSFWRDDLARVLSLAGSFYFPGVRCRKQMGFCPKAAGRIEAMARGRKARIRGRIRYDKAFQKRKIIGRGRLRDRGPKARYTTNLRTILA